MEINLGNVKGLIRKIDILGRITLPQEYRKSLKIKENEKMEMFLLENGIFIKKE